jgi:hypothetical protein
MSFLDELFQKRGLPTVGGLSFQFLYKLNNGSVEVPIYFYNIDPLTSRTEHFYNARTNTLYRRKMLSSNYAIWEPVSLV